MSIGFSVRRTLLFAAGALLSVASQAQQPARRLFSIAETETRVALTEGAASHHARAEAIGQLPGETTLPGMALVLKPTPQQDTDLTQLISEQQNPASPSYHQWLTPEQFGSRFGVSDGDIFLLQSWLQSHGFLVQSVADSRNRIVFTGTASAVESAFRVHMQRYRRGDKSFFENSDSVQLPASLAAVVGSVDGLSSYRLTAPQAKRSVSAQATVSPQYTTATGGHYLVPWDLRQIYGTNTLIGAGYDGTGIKIGIIGQSAVDTQQLTYFQQKTGQTVSLPTMVLVPNTGVSNRVSGDEGESELDLEYASGNAPGASVQFIYTGCTNITSSGVLSSSTNCNNNGVFDALSYAVTKNLAPILSLSYGGCEEENAAYANSTLEPVLRQANAQGQTILVSSGDSGAASCENSAVKTAVNGLTVSYPASSPYVIGVGGTTLNSDSSTYWSSANNSYLGSAIGYVPEVAWNDTASYSGYFVSSGGGASQIFSKPTWQVGTGVPADGKRDVPDIAFPANVTEHAYLTCDATGPCTSGAKSFTLSGTVRDGGGVGGTSAAAPTFAGMLAIVEQANGGKALGNINPSLYALAQGTSALAVFHDIITGNNIVACTVGTPNCTTGTMGYSTGVGYDLVTGLGSIAIPAFQTALAGYASNVPRIQITAPASVSAGTALTFTATVTGSGATPTGTATFSVDGTVTGTAQTLSSGTASYSYSGFTSTGSHTVSVAYSGDGTYSGSTASMLVTALSVVPTLSLGSTPSGGSINTSTTVTAVLTSPSGTPGGVVLLEVDSSGYLMSQPIVNGTATYSFAGFDIAGLHTIAATYIPIGTTTNSIFATTKASLNLFITGTPTLTPVIQATVSPVSTAPSGTVLVTARVTGSGVPPVGNALFSLDGSGAQVSRFISGSAVVSFTAPATAGSHTVQVAYYGDNTYTSATATATFSVATPSTSVSVAPTMLSAAYGSNATGTLTLTSAGGAAGTTSFALSLVSYTGATFSGCYGLSSRTLSLPANGTASATLTMYTTASSCTSSGLQQLQTATAPSVASTGNGAGQTAWALLPASLLSLFLFRRRFRPAALLVLLVTACTFGLSGCGSGSGSSSSTGGSTTTGTGTGTTTTTTTSANSGTYVIRVTASTATASSTLTSNSTFTLIVQ